MTTFRPQHMSARQLAEGTLWVGQEFYNPPHRGTPLAQQEVRSDLGG